MGEQIASRPFHFTILKLHRYRLLRLCGPIQSLSALCDAIVVSIAGDIAIQSHALPQSPPLLPRPRCSHTQHIYGDIYQRSISSIDDCSFSVVPCFLLLFILLVTDCAAVIALLK